MSHSTVLVVIRKAESPVDAHSQLDDLLAPFDENVSVPAYVNWLDEDEVERAVSFYREHPEFCTGEESGPVKPFDEYITDGNLEAWHEWTRQAVGSYCGSDRDQGVYEDGKYGYLSTYNPKSRWDWWALGGRWNGSFMLKPQAKVGAQRRGLPVLDGGTDNTLGLPGVTEESEALLGAGSFFGDGNADFTGKADLARKGAIDFDRMRDEAAEAANKVYDRFELATEGLEVPKTFREYADEAIREAGRDPEMEFKDFMPDAEVNERRKAWHAPVDVARERYRSHPWVRALHEADLGSFFGDLHEEFCVGAGGREAVVQRARDDAGRTFALLIDGQWIEKGKMGWFGMASDEMDEATWARQFWTTVDALDDDVYLAVVDVHI